MPQHANKTSFKPGHNRSEQSIKKQRETLKSRGSHPTNPWTPEIRERYRKTMRERSLGNRRITSGYWQIMTWTGYRYEHRVIMENIIGRSLERNEVVHHINGDKLDNRHDNLFLMTHSAHSSLTGKERQPRPRQPRCLICHYRHPLHS